MYLVFYFIAMPFVNLQKAGFRWHSGHGRAQADNLGKAKLDRTELASYLFYGSESMFYQKETIGYKYNGFSSPECFISYECLKHSP